MEYVFSIICWGIFIWLYKEIKKANKSPEFSFKKFNDFFTPETKGVLRKRKILIIVGLACFLGISFLHDNLLQNKINKPTAAKLPEHTVSKEKVQMNSYIKVDPETGEETIGTFMERSELIKLNELVADVAKIPLTKVLSVTDFPFTLGDKQAVDITFGGDKDNYFEVTLWRRNVYEGYIEKSVRRSKWGLIDSSGFWNRIKYCQSAKHDTNFYFFIDKLDKSTKTAEIGFGGKYIDIKEFKTFHEIPETKVTITGNYFDNLIKKIP